MNRKIAAAIYSGDSVMGDGRNSKHGDIETRHTLLVAPPIVYMSSKSRQDETANISTRDTQSFSKNDMFQLQRERNRPTKGQPRLEAHKDDQAKCKNSTTWAHVCRRQTSASC